MFFPQLQLQQLFLDNPDQLFSKCGPETSGVFEETVAGAAPQKHGRTFEHFDKRLENLQYEMLRKNAHQIGVNGTNLAT